MLGIRKVNNRVTLNIFESRRILATYPIHRKPYTYPYIENDAITLKKSDLRETVILLNNSNENNWQVFKRSEVSKLYLLVVLFEA